MKKLATFVIQKRIFILCIMLALTVIFGLMIPKVTVNDDMSKYLPDSSGMKQGVDIMADEFSDLKNTNEIRIMFKGLTDFEKSQIAKDLKKMDYVDSVSFQENDEEYNKDDYTLYCINTEYAFGSDEEMNILDTLNSTFQGYDCIIEETNNTRANLPTAVLALALTILMLILFLMSGSWIEPILFIAVIGCAVILNMGTNIFKGSVSQVTFSIAAILQLVLSMDYSIILMNRYRQELPLADSPVEAMKNALTNAFSSVTSSAVTTFVGLLMLVFMSFKIGPDLGIVLAKGVAFSLLCVFTILPALILIFHKVIMKTTKPVLPIPSGGLAKFAYKVRIPLVIGFIFLLFGSYMLQSQTEISFASYKPNEISKVFPQTNQLVLLYDTADEDKIADIAALIEQDENVKALYSYPTTLGHPYTSEELSKAIQGMGTNMEIEPYMLSMIYYRYYKGDRLPDITITNLIDFIANDLVENESFAPYLDDSIKDNIDSMKKFTDKELLTKKLSIKELSDLFGKKEDDLEKMFILYYNKQEPLDISTGTMTIKEFVDFLKNNILTDPAYASLIDANTASQISMFEKFTDKNTITRPLTYQEAASYLDMDASQLRLLYMYYFANQPSYAPESMSLPEFVAFLNRDVLTNQTFASYIGADQADQLKMLASYTDKVVITSQMTAEQMASFMTMTADQVENIYSLYYGEQKVDSTVLTLDEFLNYLLINEAFTQEMDAESLANLQRMSSILAAAKSGVQLSSSELGEIFSMSSSSVRLIITAHGLKTGHPFESTMNLTDFVDFLVSDIINSPLYSSMITEEMKEQLITMQNMIHVNNEGQTFSYQEMAGMLGIEEANVRQLYVLYAGAKTANKTMSPRDFINYLLVNPVISSQYTDEQVTQLSNLKSLMDAALSGKVYGYQEMAAFIGMDEGSAKMLYAMHDSLGDTSGWQLSIVEIIDYIYENMSAFSSMLGDNASYISLMKNILSAVQNDQTFTYGELSGVLNMPSEGLKQLYLLRQVMLGDTSTWGATLSEFIRFLKMDIMTNPDYASQIDADTAAYLDSMELLIDAILSEKAYSMDEAYELFRHFSDDMTKSNLQLLYLFYGSKYDYDKSWTMSIEEVFFFLNNDLFEDPLFEGLIDEEMKNSVSDMKEQLETAVTSMRRENHSIMSIATTYPYESDETFAFIANLNSLCSESLDSDFYIIGSSSMYYEMSNSFAREMLMMTLLTAISIFIIVLLTFRSISIPTMLVLLVQTAVFITVSASFIRGYAINFLAYLIVQCILMGATIDYAILMTNTYRECRRSQDVKTSLKQAYAGSMHTILTSGLIMIVVTGILGFSVDDPNIGPICQTISVGAASAVLLIVFVLPGMLAAFDKLVVKKKKKKA